MEKAKMDWSYKSLARYIIDLHIWLFVTLVVAYLFEPVEGYLVIKQVIGLWLVTLCMWLVLRMVTFMKKKNTEKDREELEERCTVQVQLNREKEKVLIKYASDNDLSVSEVVELAVSEYVKKHQHFLEKSDEES